jgi:hypothetical protein
VLPAYGSMSLPPAATRPLLRVAAIAISLALIVLWILFFRSIFAESQARPAPGAFMLPLFFCSLALGAGLAAARGEGVSIVLAGGLSLVPMGFVLLLFPGPVRVIGLLDIALIATGVALMRTERVGDEVLPARD